MAACSQMVLASVGIKATQRQLNQLLGLRNAGTRFTHIERLVYHKVHVSLQVGDEDDLKAVIDQGIPPVIFVHTGQLTTYWQENVQHALVVVGYDDEHFYLNDPAFLNAPQMVTVDEVMLAWLEFDYMYALITR